MKRSFFFIILSLILADLSKAGTIIDFFKTIPDGIIPYITSENRDVLIHSYAEVHDTTKVSNSFATESRLCVLTETFMDLQASDNVEYQFILSCEDRAEGDTIIYMLRTVSAPSMETVLYKYSSSWQLLGTETISAPAESFLSDTITTSQRQKALSYVEFPMVSARYDQSGGNLILTLSLPQLSCEEKNEVAKFFTNKHRKLAFNQ